MSRFQFRLQNLLELRIAERDAARQRWLDAQRAMERLDDQRRHLEHQRQQLRTRRRAQAIGPTSPDRLLADDRYEHQLAYEQADIAEKVRQVTLEVERRHQRLVEADQQAKILERLRAHRRLEHDRQMARRAQNRMDEVAVLLHHRQNAAQPITEVRER